MSKESGSSKVGRWFRRWFLGAKYEEKKTETNGQPDDSELIVSPGRQILQRFLDRKFAVFSVCVVIIMFLVVLVVPKTKFMEKYYDAFTEVTQKDLPPNLSYMSVPGELADNIKMIDSYGSFTVGLSKAGKVYVWGSTKIGATGLNVAEIPDVVKNSKIAFVTAGIDCILAMTEDGVVHGWGSNQFGQYEATPEVIDNPNLVPIPEDLTNGSIDVTKVKKMIAGYQAQAVLMEDGTLYLWGNKQTYANLDKVMKQKGIVDIDFTLNNVVAINEKRSSIVTGIKKLYDSARSSIGEKAIKMSDFLDGRKIQAITATSDSVCLLLEDGSIGLVGDFPTDVINVPTLPEGEYYTEVQGGTYHYTAVTNMGHVYSFGGDHYYQARAPKKLTTAHDVYAGAFQSYAVDENGKLVDKWGLKGYLFGTDDRGADIFKRVIAGGAVTMTVGAVAVIIEIIIGVTLGLLAGYFGGWVDMLVMRVAEVFAAIPLMPFMMIMSSLLAQVNLSQDQRLLMIMVILGVLGWPGFCRITRAQILVARESEYVTAAKSMGVKEGRIAFKHILPNIISVILVNITLSFARSMQTETSLSFLGFGVAYPKPSWGNMLTRASNATAAINFWWQWVFTSAILILTTICINTIGDTLRDVMDPKSSNDK